MLTIGEDLSAANANGGATASETRYVTNGITQLV